MTLRPATATLLAGLTGLAACCHGAVTAAGDADGAVPVRVTVTDEALHPVSGLLFGQFLERPSWGGETGPEAALQPGTRTLDPRVVSLLRDMQIPVVRFPGGTDVDYLDWRDMVSDARGAGTGRPVSRGHRGDSVTNAFGYDEFFRLAGDLRWKTILVLNLRDGLLELKPPAEAARHAAALVAYCAGAEDAVPGPLRAWPRLRAANGHPDPYTVDYVQIGNEVFGFAGWTGDELRKRYGEAWAARAADVVEAYVNAVRSVLPGARIIVDQIPIEIPGELQRRKTPVDAYAFHVYYPWEIKALFDAEGTPVPVERVSPRDVWDALVHATETDDDGLASWHYPGLLEARRSGYRIAMTEWNMNGWWDLPRKDELWPGLGGLGMGAAVMLHTLMRAGDTIDLATQSMLVGARWDIAAIGVAPGGDAAPHYRPTAQATTLYRRHLGDRRLRVRYEPGAPQWRSTLRFRPVPPCTAAMVVDVLATRDDKALYVHMLNTDYAEARRLAVRLDGFGALAGPAGLHRLRFHTPGEWKAAGAWATEETDAAAVRDRTLSVDLPPRSATVAVLALPG